MSAEIAMNVVPVEEVKTPRVRAPVLPAKYDKVLFVSFWTLQSLLSEGILSQDAFDRAIQHMHILDSLESQTQFFETFYNSTKELKKDLRKIKTPPKKTRASAVTKKMSALPVSENLEENVEKQTKSSKKATKEPKEKGKRGRKAKVVEVVNDVQDELIGKLIALANSDNHVVEPIVEEVVEEVVVEEVVVEEVVEPIVEEVVEEVVKEVVKVEKTPKKRASTKKSKNAAIEVVSEEQKQVQEEVLNVVTSIVTEEQIVPIMEEPVIEKPEKTVKKRATKKADSGDKEEKTPKKRGQKKVDIVEPVKQMENTLVEVQPGLSDSAEQEWKVATLPIDDKTFVVDINAFKDPLVQTCYLYSDTDPDILHPIASFSKLHKTVTYL
jgi:hypothetical protein